MTTVSSITSTTSTTSTTASSNSTGYDSLTDFETFLELLTTELQYQDPTDPMDSSEMVSQMSQLGMLAQMETISTNVAAYGAMNLIGKAVTYQTTDSDGSTVETTGTVASVVTSSGDTYLKILNDESGEYELVSPSYIYEVSEA